MPPLSRLVQIFNTVFGTNNAIDIAVQDQTTAPLDFYFVRIVAATTTLLNAITTVDPDTLVYTFDIVESTGMSVGDYIGIFENSTDERYFFAEIKIISSPTGNATITVDTPLDFNFRADVTVAAFDRNMNVDGSSTPQIFQVEVGPASALSIDLNRIMYQMKTSIAPTLGLFGDLARLDKGIVLRIVRAADDSIQNIFTIKDNAQMSLHAFDLQFFTVAGQGQDGVSSRSTFNGQDKRGVTVRLEPGDMLQLIIQDDLNTAQSSAQITEFFMMAQGHVVDP